MTPTLVALAGKARVGKGTCVAVFQEEAAALGLTIKERQFSGPGKQHLARIWHPDIDEPTAIAWFETLKPRGVTIEMRTADLHHPAHTVTLQEFMQHGLQEGGRDIWGSDFWTDMMLPKGMDKVWDGMPRWQSSFLLKQDENTSAPADICLISDERQDNEARRVREHGGINIEIRRVDHEDAYVTNPGHITEQGLDPELVDEYIYNIDFETYKDACKELFHKVIVPRLERS